MGNTSSRQRLREPFISLETTVYRNLQNWTRLQPVVEWWKNATGYEDPNANASSQPAQHTHEQLTPKDEDGQLGLVKKLLEWAMPTWRSRPNKNPSEEREVQPEQEPPEPEPTRPEPTRPESPRPEQNGNEHNADKGQQTSGEQANAATSPSSDETTLEQNRRGIQNMQSLIDRVAPTQDSMNKPKPEDNASVEDQEEYVSAYIRSSLNVALPVPDRHRPNTSSAFPKLVYKPRDFTESTTSGSARSVETNHSEPTSTQTTLSASDQKKLEETRANYETWDKKLYSNLRLDQKSIRLVEILPGSSEEIRVDLIQKPLDEIAGKYEALSYVWGAPTPAGTIFVNKIEVQVNPSLFDALKGLRLRDAKRSIWIDAICVNQTSIRERSIEVRKMGEIYRQAKTVVVFLGAPSPSGSSIGELFEFLKKPEKVNALEYNQDGKPTNIDEVYQDCEADKYAVCKGFIELCLRPWWSRIWVMQEFYLATDEPVWYWGSEHVSNASLKRDMQLLMDTAWQLYSSGELSGEANLNSKFTFEVKDMTKKPLLMFKNEVERIQHLISRRAQTNGYDVPSRLYRELSAKATDPRDIVYGLREIFDPLFRNVFVPDYFMGVELLFACLAVFLIQFEAWSDVLWWYPHRFDGAGGDQFPSWLPDFTRRIEPTESEYLPRDHTKSRRNEPKLVILDHVLHAEGYKLGTLAGHMHIPKGDGRKALRCLWEFDQVTNRKQGVNDDTTDEEQQDHSLLSDFLQVCGREFKEGLASEKLEYSVDQIAYPTKVPVTGWTSRVDEDMPSNIILALPWFDILWFYAYRVGDQAIVGLLNDEEDEQGLLDDIFDFEMDNVFRRTLAHSFITACVLDWENLDLILDRLISAMQWSGTPNSYWLPVPSELSVNKYSEVRPWLLQISEELQQQRRAWGDLLHYSGLIYAVLFGCKDHAAFTRVVSKLRLAATELHDIALDYRAHAHVEELKAESDIVAARIRRYDAIVAKYQGRVLFCTEQGFRGLSSPGVSECGTSVALLDGLSFPVVLRDAGGGSGRQKLVGCAVVRGVDMQGGDVSKVQVPAGFDLGEKTVFKLT